MIGRGYVIEHIDDDLYEWSIIEYRSIVRMTQQPVIIANLGHSLAKAQELLPTAHCYAESFTVQEVDPQRVCLLDMRGDTPLSPADIDRFDYFLFGGILGDHPPRDRTKQLRDRNYPLRHLGVMQMPTNTAMNVVKLIIEDQRPLEDLPFVDSPEFPVTSEGCEETIEMEGFRYLADENGEPIIEPEMLPLLARDLTGDDFF
mmetsp:Transcript_26671/g.48020  ORF Transcript_26671/g.48020 Transcript_26671/m.48020 type:complete len:202 (-) Transcript_26671:587-1192(-)